ncbi:MAG: NrfD/PsrC family molybdoenzyme membrane anchor subunit [Candidatus Kariarchaeaceae archaeon]|jgi:molybdopterin-containing oxidoreductase family membrane subunit
MSNKLQQIEDTIVHPITSTTRNFYLLVLGLLIPIGIGLYGWIVQLRDGLGVTGLSHRIFWGIYISNFIFFIGISYSGTLISAVLRLTNSGWRTPLTRMAEAITVIGIAVGFSMILIDMGRPDRVFLVPVASRLQSPLFWDMLSVSTYLMGSLIYFLLPMIPDMAIMRDRYANVGGLRYRIYRFLSMGWKGTETQKHYMERGISIMSLILIPIAVMCHTVIAFIFAMTWRVGWHSTIFGPYFVVAAIFSGTAAIIVAMAVIRWVYGFQEYITVKHFKNLGMILFVLLALYFYFTVTEYFTTAYRAAVPDMELMTALLFESYAVYFWTFMIFGMIIPGLMIMWVGFRYDDERAVNMLFVASLLVVIGMWIKRYIIIVPALARPFVEQEWTLYNPSWVEVWITLAGFAGFILIFALIVKFFPILSIWELQEEEEHRIEAEKNLYNKYKEKYNTIEPAKPLDPDT